jgi:hypothetical protein
MNRQAKELNGDFPERSGERNGIGQAGVKIADRAADWRFAERMERGKLP